MNLGGEVLATVTIKMMHVQRIMTASIGSPSIYWYGNLNHLFPRVQGTMFS